MGIIQIAVVVTICIQGECSYMVPAAWENPSKQEVSTCNKVAEQYKNQGFEAECRKLQKYL